VTRTLLADLILAAHFGIAAFICAGLVLVPIGAWRGWHWVRRRRWRQLHLWAIIFVALESALGLACPLTVWEDALRGRQLRNAGFIERWVGALLYYDLPPTVFLMAYAAAALLAWGLWIWVTPAPPAGRRLGAQ
jgi:hypothetical protein